MHVRARACVRECRMDGANYPRSFALASSTVMPNMELSAVALAAALMSASHETTVVLLLSMCSHTRISVRREIHQLSSGKPYIKVANLLLGWQDIGPDISAEQLSALPYRPERVVVRLWRDNLRLIPATCSTFAHHCARAQPAIQLLRTYCLLSYIREIDRDRDPRSAPPRCPSSAALAKCAPLSATSGAVFIAQRTEP